MVDRSQDISGQPCVILGVLFASGVPGAHTKGQLCGLDIDFKAEGSGHLLIDLCAGFTLFKGSYLEAIGNYWPVGESKPLIHSGHLERFPCLEERS